MQAQEITQQPAPLAASQALPAQTLEASKASKPTGGIGSFLADLVFTALIAAIAAFAVVHFLPQWAGEKTVQTQKIAVIDMDKLSRDHMRRLTDQVRAGDIEVGDMTKKTTEFAQQLMERMHAMSNQGVVVLDAKAVIAAPSDVQDLTELLQEELKSSSQAKAQESR